MVSWLEPHLRPRTVHLPLSWPSRGPAGGARAERAEPGCGAPDATWGSMVGPKLLYNVEWHDSQHLNTIGAEPQICPCFYDFAPRVVSYRAVRCVFS